MANMSTHHPSFSHSSGFGSVFKSWTSSLKTTSSKGVPVQINPTVVGGGSDQKKLFLELQNGPLPQRASTAAKMTEALQKYSISSIPEVWYLGRDMCDPKIQSYIRRVAINLMIECIKCDDLTSTSVKLMYYRDIVSFCQLSDYKIDHEFDLFLQALKALTHDGRDIQEFCVYEQTTRLPQLLILSLNVLSRSVKSFENLSQEDLESNSAYQNLLSLLGYIKNCLKFNAHTLEEYYIEAYISKIIQIGFQSPVDYLIRLSVEGLSAALIFSNVSSRTLLTSIQFLCSVYGSDERLTDMAWSAITALASHGIFFIISNCLNEIITDDELRSYRTADSDNMLTAVMSNTTVSTFEQNSSKKVFYSCVGAIQIIERFTISPSVINTGDTALIYHLESLQKMVSYNVPVLNSTLLRSLDRLFSKYSYTDEFNINTVMEQVYLFQLWYSSRSSIYDLLTSIKLFSDIDINYWKSICLSLQKAFENHELHTPKEKLVNLFISHYQYLPTESVKFVLGYYNEEKLLTVLHPLWRDNCLKLLNNFYSFPEQQKTSELTKSENLTEIKILVLRTMKASFEISYSIERSGFEFGIIVDILKKTVFQSDPQVMSYFMDEFVVRACSKLPITALNQVCDTLLPLFEVKPNKRIRSLVSVNSSGFGSSSQWSYDSAKVPTISDASKVIIARGIVKLLIQESTRDAQKALVAYRLCILLAQHALSIHNSELLLVISKCLVRIRVSNEGYIYFTNPNDMEGLATVFQRNTLDSDFKHEDHYEWVYPENIAYISQEYFDKPVRDLKLFNSNSTKLELDVSERTIDIETWFSIVLDVMDHFFNWEVYSFIWAHFCPQLANLNLFINSKEQLVRFKSIVCNQLTLNLPSNLSLPEGISKSHLQVAFVRTFSALIGYHRQFSKQDEDDIIRSLLFGIDSWERTAIPCIHILTVCCFEIPMSIKKFLSTILSKFQTKVTSTFASSHILEFLISLINVPSLTSNLNIDDVKRIFGIAFKFIDHSNDAIKNKAFENASELVPKHGLNAAMDNTPSTLSTQEHAVILLQYVLALSFNLIATWFLKLDMKDRKKMSSFILRSLLSGNSTPQALDDQVAAFVDLIIRFTYNDLPLKIVNPRVAIDELRKEGNVQINNWITGLTITTIASVVETGSTLVIYRRPTGVIIFRVEFDNSVVPNKLRYSHKQLITPNHYIVQQLANLDIDNKGKPIALMDDPTTTRAISTIDRMPTVEFHKIGILYIGRGQNTEPEVLGNRGGSVSYQKFLNSVGESIKLKDCKEIYVGGLDIENNTDGEYGIYWSDKTVQMIFHTTSLMPNHEKDPYFDLKKKHIGNNYVNIFFDESGLPFDFNLIKSQFNFINIVIQPHSKNFDHYSKSNYDESKRLYKVKLFRRSGVPGVFASCHFKIISEDVLPNFVRSVAISASQFANVWHANYHGRFASNWAHRVKQVKVLKDRALETHNLMKQEQSEQDNPGINDATQSFMQQLEFDTETSVNANPNRYEYLTDRDNELYSVLEFNSFT